MSLFASGGLKPKVSPLLKAVFKLYALFSLVLSVVQKAEVTPATIFLSPLISVAWKDGPLLVSTFAP